MMYTFWHLVGVGLVGILFGVLIGHDWGWYRGVRQGRMEEKELHDSYGDQF
jgi:hypothetical protein